jgi:hypothetical protein
MCNCLQPLAEHFASTNVDCSGFEPMAASGDLVCCVHTLAAIHGGVMWIEECQPVTFVKLAIRHHLINITLRHALLGVIHTAGDPLPFRVDDLHDLVATLY